jgi:hypothetical protein
MLHSFHQEISIFLKTRQNQRRRREIPSSTILLTPDNDSIDRNMLWEICKVRDFEQIFRKLKIVARKTVELIDNKCLVCQVNISIHCL